MRDRHKIAEGKDPDFIVMTQKELSDTFTETSRIMTIVLGVIASVSLVVGGIGIMNIMLANILERTREIGVRRAVGARRSDVLRQFLIEAVLISFLGGMLGIALGMSMSKIIAVLAGWSTVTSVNSIVLSFVFSVSIGLIFGLYPALKAAKLDPVEAMRYE